ncbi:MAG: ABC transporter permease [Gemmataceae bacterium]
MSTRAVIEKKDQTPAPGRWTVAPEQAPSVMGEPAPMFARVLGMIGLLLVMAGSLILLINNYGSKSTLAAYLGPGWGTFIGVFGIGLMLYHAVQDADLEMRRAYMVFGYLWLVIGAIVSVIPADGHAGARFLPYGFTCFSLGLLFVSAFLRNETEARQRDLAIYVLGGIGVALGVGGFLFGSIFTQFLFPRGVVVVLLALPFWWAFASLRGTSTDQGYYAGVAMGATGLLFFVIALIRSVIPPLAGYFRWSGNYAGYLMPYGLVLMGCGAVYFLVAVLLCSDAQVVVQTRRELISYFQSPLAYIIILGFGLLAAYMFLLFVLFYLWTNGIPRAQLEPIVRYYLASGIYPVSLVIVVPMLTMRLFSEEKRSGTLEMLLTTPLSEWVLVVSKFLAALFFLMLIHLPWALEFVGLRDIADKPFDYRPLLAFFVALLFTGANLVAMGLFFSSLTRNQLTAALLTFVGLLILVTAKSFQEFLTKDGLLYIIVEHLSFLDVLVKSLEGRLALRDLFIQISACVFWLFLTTKVLESRKWR